MIRAMFLEAMQAYYAPVVILVFFAGILTVDQLLTRREKHLFLMELGMVGLMILSTWADRCVSAIPYGNWWMLRFATSAMQFAAAPLSPLILLRIYRRNQRARVEWLFTLPAVVTALLSLSSIWTGLVLRVEPGNIYSRGPLFLLPFLTSAFYMVFIFRSATQRETPGRRLEAIFLLCAGAAIAGACIFEILFVIRYMIWSTTGALLLAYFLMLTMLKVLYDPQTGVYSRLAYSKRLESIREGQPLTFVMVDMNGLKAINDRYGHKVGDQAITMVSQALLTISGRGRKLYRYGGDEFVIVANGWCAQTLEAELARVASSCGAVEEIPLSFAYGLVEYRDGSLRLATEEMDRRMYQHKAEMKERLEELSAAP